MGLGQSHPPFCIFNIQATLKMHVPTPLTLQLTFTEFPHSPRYLVSSASHNVKSLMVSRLMRWWRPFPKMNIGEKIILKKKANIKKNVENCVTSNWINKKLELMLSLILLLVTTFHKTNAVTWSSQVSKNVDEHKKASAR